MSKTLLQRFEEKVNKTDGCWEWVAAHNERGYGRINIDGKSVATHRVAYELYVGNIPEGMCVCHHCDNPKCVNPDHLFLGTHTENMRDCRNKGRRPLPITRGERHAGSKLTEEQVKEIRSRYPGSKSQSELAREYGVAQTEIWRIIHRVRWANI